MRKNVRKTLSVKRVHSWLVQRIARGVVGHAKSQRRSHLYTSSDFEKDSIIASSESEYIYEGVAFKAYSLEYGAANEKLEVIRFFNTQSNTHMYSSSENECEILNESDLFINEGIAWYTDFI